MDSVLITAPRDYDAEFRLRLQPFGMAESGEQGTFVLDDGQSRVYIRRNVLASDELEPDEMEQILDSIENPVFYSVDFTDIDFGRRVIESVADDPDLLVDNDHGVRMPGSDFVRLLRSRPSWDWRLESE